MLQYGSCDNDIRTCFMSLFQTLGFRYYLEKRSLLRKTIKSYFFSINLTNRTSFESIAVIDILINKKM